MKSFNLFLKPKETHYLSEFECAVCNKKANRVIETEWPYMRFEAGSFEFHLIWVCSEECKVTYTLQKE